MYQVVNLEISGFCNAKCPWCISGRDAQAVPNKKNNEKFITPELFEKIINRLLELKIIDKNSIFYLFNWGEPLIHPKISELITILNKYDLFFGFSTNASKVINVDNISMKKLVRLELSMPGFSQASYDKIHGFNFKKILSNIDELMDRFKKSGFKGTPNLAYHIYQFNIHEIPLAKEFCKTHNIDFLPYAAHTNDFRKTIAYLNNTMDSTELMKISKDLLMYYVDDLIAQRPENYSCPQYGILTIDESGNLLTCCVVPKDHQDYSLGSIFNLSAEEINTKKRTREICGPCSKSGADYWGHTSYVPAFIQQDMRGKLISLAKWIFPKPVLRKIRNYYFRLRG